MMAFSAFLLAAGMGHGQSKLPPIPLPAETDSFGKGIQRTMSLLATSTPSHRNTVRILFYGQSITEQAWSAQVADWLRKTYPNANLIIENRAIGGHASQLLWRTAEADLYPFQPDLLVFYVYGSHVDYETIIANTRKRTTAEVMLQTEHITRDADLVESDAPPTADGAHWSAWMSEVFLPDLARRFDCELIDQRRVWRKYLVKNQYPASRFLRDGIHLNDAGCDLMASIVKQHFVYLPQASNSKWKGLARDYRVGKDAVWKHGVLRVDFIGNRVDAIFGNGKGLATFTIDGKPASSFPGAFATTRASAFPGTNWPMLLRASLRGLPQAENWRARILDASEDGKHFRFELFGSKTGMDGSGLSDQPFVSRSGRISIQPEDWNLAYCKAVFHRPIPTDLEVQWQVIPLFAPGLQAPIHPDRTLESSITLVESLPNGPHTLEIHSSEPQLLDRIRVYRPKFG